jgi:hypothetical protein
MGVPKLLLNMLVPFAKSLSKGLETCGLKGIEGVQNECTECWRCLGLLTRLVGVKSGAAGATAVEHLHRVSSIAVMLSFISIWLIFMSLFRLEMRPVNIKAAGSGWASL